MLGMAVIVTVEEAEKYFSRLIDRVVAGEDILIAYGGQTVRMLPIKSRETTSQQSRR